MEDIIPMSRKERKQIPILEQLMQKEVAQTEAAILLNMNDQNIRRRLIGDIV